MKSNLIISELDKSSVAKMQKRIAAQSSLIRKTVKEYNSLNDMSRNQPCSELDVNHYLKAKSSALSTKKEMVQIAHKRHRALEEEKIVKRDMVLTITFCQDEQQKLQTEIDSLKTVNNPTQYQIGSIGCLMEELIGVECFLRRAVKAFEVLGDTYSKIKYYTLDAQGVFDPLAMLTDKDKEELEQMLLEEEEEEEKEEDHDFSDNITPSDDEDSYSDL